MLPFSREHFFGVFESYNSAVWPAHVALYLLASILVALALAGGRRRTAIPLGLAFLWLWTGIVYHWWHFTAINPAARWFGALFALQGLLFVAAAANRRLDVGPPRGWRGWIGGLLLVYALAVYPLLGLIGHPVREVPLLGVPCPTTIFTFGLLFWAAPRVPRRLLVVPLLWAFLGGSAVVLLGVAQDLGLLAAGLLGLVLLRRPRFDGDRSDGDRSDGDDRVGA